MSLERTFSIIKPDAVERNKIGEITAMLESAGLRIVASKRILLNHDKAAEFYAVHSDKPFFNDLVSFMTRGPIVAAALEKDNAVEAFRTLIGSTDPNDAEEGTIRKKFAKSKGENAVHGSDSDENADIEISFHFDTDEIFS